jgi:hydantoinase/carbamoylase family amidase
MKPARSPFSTILNRTTPSRQTPSRVWLRSLCCTRPSSLRTTELQNLSSITVDSARLWETIHSTAQWTAKSFSNDIKHAGLSRLALTDDDKRAREWFISTTESLGCKTHVDQMGNIFAIRPGLSNNSPATFVGSHLDSQPSGGRFDGVLGVAAGIEMLRVLNDNWIETEGPVGVVNWTNEEGARFPVSMMGSSVWAGRVPLGAAWNVRSVSSGIHEATVKEELERIGYLGKVACENSATGTQLGAHFELHIEQGPKLERARQKIGVVEGVQAYKWFTVTITGRESHAGTTDFRSRGDALFAAATFIHKVRSKAKSLLGLATVGTLKVSPGSVNTVPGQVTMSLDVRNPQDRGLARTVQKIQDYIALVNTGTVPERATPTDGTRHLKRSGSLVPPEEAQKYKEQRENPLTRIQIDITEDFSSNAVKFNEDAIKCIEASAVELVGKDKITRLTSGAGHDSVCTNVHCPTGMIFVPCKDGVSHNPSEWCEQDDCATGANVLLQSVLRMDRLRKQSGQFD